MKSVVRTTAAEAKPPKVKKGLEIGDSGTPMFSGVINDEYNTKLAGTAGITVYDEMRRSDGTVEGCNPGLRAADPLGQMVYGTGERRGGGCGDR